MARQGPFFLSLGQIKLIMEKIQNLISGKFLEPTDGNYCEIVEPATGKPYALLPLSSSKDVDLAVKAAKMAFPEWSRFSIDKRSACLRRLAEIISLNLDELALAESKDNGKPLKLAQTVDIPRASKNFSFFADAITQFASESHHMVGTAINYTLRQPIGVVGCISPWNLPLYLFSWKIAPALAAGNCVVAKPSEVTPMTAFLLSKFIKEAGFPDGVFNIVHGLGPEAGQAIVDHVDVKAISFTGGTQTGAAIAASAAPKFKKLSLELGGKNPAIVFDDCDFEKMLSTVVLSSFANQGQICLCGSRILIQESIYDKFKDAFIDKVKKVKVGDPLDKDTKMGALVSKEHLEKVLSYVELAKKEGGKILFGGNRVYPEGRCSEGYFMEPTVIEGLSAHCRTNQEEIFGPIVSLIPFKDEKEAVGLANCTSFGLAASLWTSDVGRAHRMPEVLDFGIVWVNCWLLRDLRTPFGGLKNSGVGREGGWEALRFFTEAKNVCIKVDPIH